MSRSLRSLLLVKGDESTRGPAMVSQRCYSVGGPAMVSQRYNSAGGPAMVPQSHHQICSHLKMHQLGFVDPEDLNITSGKRKYSSAAGYSGSKLAEIMFSSVLQRKLPSEAGVNVMCVFPGVVMTNVARDLPSIIHSLAIT
ncbi:hypothetical protein SUGI_0648400 [Cryptomeria japonica]|nr:hypothetical protein SUGI_0648400 [Cryptomeria japonica]